MIANAKVSQRLEGFVAKVQAETLAYYAKKFPTLIPSIIEVEEGSKFYRIVKAERGTRSVHSFVSKANGDIFKAAGWKAPAKHVRGNIFAADYGWSSMNVYGAKYLR